ncbi:hypothetical protein A3B57_00245 [Microgenomates group bacterium RIFCSPLOWO2_01_FULL_47_10]|nr:MAG: hypothetical protein A3B57_00245 [Microgenomates group bacterium RIFCSPLOWO2_01_FULL_47_10]
MAIVFDGNAFAAKRLETLKERVRVLGKKPMLVSVVFAEDSMGMLYTKLKAQAASEIGIGFEKVELRYHDSIHDSKENIGTLGKRAEVDGMLVQKPNKKQYLEWILNRVSDDIIAYEEWWEEIASAIDPKKDVDCLTRDNLDKVYRGEGEFLPATARAVVSILEALLRPGELRTGEAGGGTLEHLKGKKIAMVGRSELVGKPLAFYLQYKGARVQILGSKDKLIDRLPQSEIIISATGQAGLITGDMVNEGITVIDVGEPRGDVDFASVLPKASFITPVPGGVGPVTVVSLLENLLDMRKYN